MVDISIVIPAYNEVERIESTLMDFEKVLSTTSYSYELLVVDDGSKDGTREFVGGLKNKISAIRTTGSSKNNGKGYAVRKGMLEAKGNIRVISDADGSTPPDQVIALITPIIEGKAEVSIGSRYLEGSDIEEKQPLYRRIWSRMSSKLIQRILLPGIVDAYCGFKAYNEESAEKVFNQCNINGWAFDIEALVIAKSLDYRVSEVPVRWINDDDSKVKKSQFMKEMYSLWKIKKRVRANR